MLCAYIIRQRFFIPLIYLTWDGVCSGSGASQIGVGLAGFVGASPKAPVVAGGTGGLGRRDEY